MEDRKTAAYREQRNKREQKKTGPQKRSGLLSMDQLPMELRGIEPLSESLSTKASPITADYLNFPSENAGRQALSVGSFMILSQPQSFGRKVPRFHNAGLPRERETRFRQLHSGSES
jgi:hypothetical protein